MTIDFRDKNVLITGGSRGIGSACAKVFAEANANVIITYHANAAKAEETISLLQCHNQQHENYQLDVHDAASIERFFESVISRYAHIDVLVNNAGIYLHHPIMDVQYAEWQHAWGETVGTNLIGAANMCYFAGRHMAEQGGGKIVNVSSRGAFRGEPDHPAYGASKAGLNAMSQSLAVALAPYGVTVGVVAPGFVDTDMATAYLQSDAGEAVKKQSPLNRVATAEEVARAILMFAADGFEFMTGGIIDINGASYLRS